MRYGYFDNENREYVIERPDAPVSWTNYLGVRDLCTVISHNAGGYSFYQNAEHQRITRFRANGVPLDRPGRYVYLRDDETGVYVLKDRRRRRPCSSAHALARPARAATRRRRNQRRLVSASRAGTSYRRSQW